MFQKLQREFEPELRILRDRVDEPGTKTTPLERQQFSTTSKLRSDVIESH
ncbi:MAG: carbohydrate porin [Plectolyngbya sp. WJT66-NPBG17]|nr:carbohydrate porin [Plectolyngbya sp. WJT66-NPBG17]MBW4527635.1 carbohydrate porin [Phormidium tanganyikae FI6-MK23]